MLEINQIYNEDCLDGMKKIDDKSIDMILCDLPYGTTKCKWDSIIDLKSLWKEYTRIIKDNGYILLFAQTPFDKMLGYSNLNMLKYEWIWVKDKPTGHLNANYAPMKAHENILVFTNDNTSYSKNNPINSYYIKDMLTEVNREITRTNKHGIYDLSKKQSSKQKYTGYPNDVLYYSNDKEKLHPTQKPVNLCKFLIERYTKENMIVLDNCMGSGTTAISCINTNRSYIGFELDNTYYEIAKNRIEETLKNQGLQNEKCQ